MWDSCVNLKHGLVLLFSEQQECETSTASLVLSSPSLCMITYSFSLSVCCSDACSSLKYWGVQAVVWRGQLITSASMNIQCTNESDPPLGIEV